MVGTVLVGVLALPATALAATGPTSGGFGEHVVACEQMMGFTGQHNPGMHQGFSGWDPTHTC